MGQTLSEPITTKETTSVCNSNYSVGASCMQGWRISMEDAHTILLNLPNDPGAAYFGVFDGHGGAKIAQHSSAYLHKVILNQPEYASGDYAEAIRKGFLALDEDMQSHAETRDNVAGTTAIICLVREGQIYCGNAGDSRAIASVAGNVEVLSYDHKPNLASERQRIEAAGGFVDWNRVNGNLALSRALGDFVFKKNKSKSAEEQVITANPDVIVKSLTRDHEFIVLACDGIWDVMSNEEVVQFVRTRISQGMQPQIICEELMMQCLALPNASTLGTGMDNMSVILVCFLHGEDYSALQKKCCLPPQGNGDK